MPTARTKANRKYNEKAYDRIELTVPKGEKATIAEAAAQAGTSVNAFIWAAVKDKMGNAKNENPLRLEPKG